MSLEGTASPLKQMKGNINRFTTYHTDAYMIAVRNGFKGTEAEWLESLAASEEEIAQAVADYMEKNNIGRATIGVVELKAAKWVTSGENIHSQIVTIPGVTQKSRVLLSPSIEQLAIFHDKDLAFVTENEDGVVTVYALGDKPLNDYTMQVTIEEVSV